MKLTPLDIHHKEFRHQLKGYNQLEVDEFLDEVADEFERLFKENIDQAEKLEAMQDKVRQYEQIEQSLQNTLVSAQKSAEDILTKARGEADFVLRDAEVKAKEIIHTALAEKQRIQAELMRMKKAEDDFRSTFRGQLEQQLNMMSEVRLPEDVTLPTDEGAAVSDLHRKVDGLRAEIPQMATESPAPVPEPVSAPAPEPAAFDQEEPPAPEAQAAPQMISVQSLQLGEVGAPDLGPEEPSFEEPPEFAPFGAVGEREDDVDIEEID